MVKSGIALSTRKTVCFIHLIEIYPLDCFNNLLGTWPWAKTLKILKHSWTSVKEPLFIYSDQAPVLTVFINWVVKAVDVYIQDRGFNKYDERIR